MSTPLYALRKSQRSTARRLRFERNKRQRLNDARIDREFLARWPLRRGTGNYILRGKVVVPETHLMRWARRFERANRTIGRDQITDEVWISTVFLGIDYGSLATLLDPDAKPVVFETMIFGGPRDSEQHRYTDWDTARAAHVALANQLRCENDQPIPQA